uniref:Phosphatidylinositol N-acetylglucosaminyltransferase subunit H n=2 Tax=Anthurium amnicola TaxID=1678845 RepID=A0A1D1Z383_9ARAE
MSKVAFFNSRYTYCHENKRGFPETIDVHEIIISRSKRRIFFLFFFLLLVLLHVSHVLLVKEQLGVSVFGTLLTFVLIAKLFQFKTAKKESVVIMPAFGVQLETHYWSGRATRHFVSTGRILKPVLNEVVTPLTCYWSLALILRGEDKLLLVFQESRPPLKMLVPIWEALCAAASGGEFLETSMGCDLGESRIAK